MKAFIVRNSVEEYIMGILFIKDDIAIDEIKIKISEFMESVIEKGGCFDYTTDDVISYFPQEWNVSFVSTLEMEDIETILI